MFPEEGLEHVVTLKVHHNRHLRVFPGPERFHAAHTLVLSYAYHCCPYLRDDDYGMATEEPPRYIEDVIYNVEDIQDFDNSLLLNMSDFWSDKGKDDTLDKPASDAALKTREQQLSANLKRSSAAAQTEPPLATDADFVSDGMAEDFGTIWSKLAKDFTPRVVKDLLPDSGPSISSTDRPFYPRAPVLCIPKPGPFMPCRDLFDWWTLRCGVWIVFLLALLGNGTVVVVLCFARSKIDVPRFLVANLALADFFMGIYLGFLAVVDASTLGEFRMYAIPWQMSTGCQVAGFIGVFSSELSVFTLTVITLERNYAITHAMHLNKRLSLRHAAYVMLGGWVFAGTMAALPLVGISDYRKFAVCLPFETGGAGLIVTKELETEASPEDTPPEDRLFMSVAATEDIDKDRALIAEAIKKTDYRFHTTPKEKLRSRYYKSRRYPSDGNIRKRCDSPCPLHGGKDYIRRVATMPVILADVEPSPLFDVSPPSEEEYDVFIDTAVPQGLLETHFPLEEPPTEGDPLL
ncbi:hypothetical protein HAZT_HAZT001868 [Hyalella azteca]|uniref:G-protein coupled receptors family 1 profile domain-containing protein n=1 Tax=Hyalella azteca TaxID=294128 RepID=A0A6A0H1K8_HYAAZ|nr:hypothetical protein HAZT_HAZT001868 [Hyalella azteca]